MSTETAPAAAAAWSRPVRRDLQRAGGTLFAGLALLGIVQGFVWLAVAPGVAYKIYADGAYLALPTSSYHSFAGLAIFVLSGAAIGLVSAAAAWRVRAVRGTVVLLMLTAANAVGAAVAALIARLPSGAIDPAAVGATGAESIVSGAPILASPLAILAQPLLAALTYTALVAWDGRPGLGRRRMSELAAAPR